MSYKNIFIYYIGYVIVRNLCFIKINSVGPLNLIDKINGYIEQTNKNKYLTVVLAYESKDILKKLTDYYQ